MYTLDEYYEIRKQIVENNQNLVGVVLNEKEKQLDEKFSLLKEEYIKSCNNDVPYDMPILKDERIRNSELYKFLVNMPKGSDLHVHGTSLVPIHKLLDFIIEHEKLLIDIDTLILTYDSNDKTCSLKEALAKGLVDKDNLLKTWTILGCKEGQDPWSYFESMFAYHAAIDEDYEILKDYYIFAFEYYLNINIYHVEIHVLLSKDQETTNKTINTIKEAYYEVKKKHNELIVSLIGTSMKLFETIEETKEIINCVLNAHNNIKDDYDLNNIHDFILGIDLINEEDKSRPLIEYAPLLIDVKSKHPDFEYYLHCGESINARNDNLIDAFLLKAERVGHGTNLYKYPELLKNYADNEICLESCLISNQALGYVKDLRLHPSGEYLKRGVTIALCSDDPNFLEYETLVDDYFAATICWDLGLAEIKHLCLNSIMYAGIDSFSKQKLMADWFNAWKKFIEQ